MGAHLLALVPAVAGCVAGVLAGCGEDPPPSISYGAMAPLAGDAGRGGFRFGVATAATQIEDMNPATATDRFCGKVPAP